MNPGLVIVLGMGVVFLGLILLIIAIAIMNGIIGMFGKKEDKVPEKPQTAAEEDEMDHDLLVAIVASSIAAATDTDAKGLRIVSLKRI